MMSSKSIDNLVPDIYQLIKDKTRLDPQGLAEFGTNVSIHLKQTMENPEVARVRDPGVVYPSELGKACSRQAWYKYHKPDAAEKLLPHTEIKFFVGDFAEELLLYLAKEAGHAVTHEQQVVDYTVGNARVRGRIDAVIDGHIVDVKSTSPVSFGQWSGRSLNEMNDRFGYTWQLNSYCHAPSMFPASLQTPYLFLFDKQNGKLGLSEVPKIDYDTFSKRVTNLYDALNKSTEPERAFKPEPRKTAPGSYLNVACQYCDYKTECWVEHNPVAVLRKSKVVWMLGEKPGDMPKIMPDDILLENPNDATTETV